MKRKQYLVEIRERGRWVRTWWTDEANAPIAGRRTKLRPQPAEKTKADEALRLARRSHPNKTYRITEVSL